MSAFCSLPRPSKREIAQLEDLTLPLFDQVSVDSRRFVAAALSECEYAPAGLVRRLCDQTVDIAAPLLIRSRVLTDVDLIALIGRHGLPHARAIARRPGLTKAIADLIRVLERPKLVHPASPGQPGDDGKADTDKIQAPSDRLDGQDPVPGQLAENARRKLRSMMRSTPHGQLADAERHPAQLAYGKLRDTALTGNAAFFHTALADALEVDFATARSITESSGQAPLLDALKALELLEEEAFLIAACVFPMQFAHPEAVRLFLERYRLLSSDVARDKVRGWKAAAIGSMVRRKAPRSSEPHQAAPADEPDNGQLRAS